MDERTDLQMTLNIGDVVIKKAILDIAGNFHPQSHPLMVEDIRVIESDRFPTYRRIYAGSEDEGWDAVEDRFERICEAMHPNANKWMSEPSRSELERLWREPDRQLWHVFSDTISKRFAGYDLKGAKKLARQHSIEKENERVYVFEDLYVWNETHGCMVERNGQSFTFYNGRQLKQGE